MNAFFLPTVRFFSLFVAAIWGLAPTASGQSSSLPVASLHPLISDLAQQVGGSRIKVEGIMTTNDDPHSFRPTASDLRKIDSARLILVSGKGIESYLPKLRDNLKAGQSLLEVGRKIPSIKVTEGNLFVCCPEHSHGTIDPHWWHSPENMKRAATILADAFSDIDPAGKSTYKANAKVARKQLDALNRWAKKELSVIPRKQRKLVTAHSAFGYFCKAFGFKAVPVRGLTREHEPSAKYLATTIRIIQDHKIKAVFPEAAANPKVLKEMVRATGIQLGGELIADGTGKPHSGTFKGMLQHNIGVITKALKP